MTPQTANQINSPQVGQVETVSGESPAAAYQLAAQVTKLKSQLATAQKACAEKDADLDHAVSEWKRYAQAAEDADAANVENIKTIARLTAELAAIQEVIRRLAHAKELGL